MSIAHGLEAAIGKRPGLVRGGARVKSMCTGGAGSVLVQRMIAAEYAGVLFTRDPSAGGLVMIEMVKGTAENLVSGAVRPHTCVSAACRAGSSARARRQSIFVRCSRSDSKCEQLFGCPQDIEWTYRGGRFHLVQSRDITRAGDGRTRRGHTAE